MAKGSQGRHGGGHKDRDRGTGNADRKAADRATQARLSQQRGKSTDGRKGKPTGQGGGEGRGPKGDE